jgi:hypothetical protein
VFTNSPLAREEGKSKRAHGPSVFLSPGAEAY